MIERWALLSGLMGDLETYELIQKDLKNTRGDITLFVLGDLVGPNKKGKVIIELPKVDMKQICKMGFLIYTLKFIYNH